jgi:hypothetical protein
MVLPQARQALFAVLVSGPRPTLQAYLLLAKKRQQRRQLAVTPFTLLLQHVALLGLLHALLALH